MPDPAINDIQKNTFHTLDFAFFVMKTNHTENKDIDEREEKNAALAVRRNRRRSVPPNPWNNMKRMGKKKWNVKVTMYSWTMPDSRKTMNNGPNLFSAPVIYKDRIESLM